METKRVKRDIDTGTLGEVRIEGTRFNPEGLGWFELVSERDRDPNLVALLPYSRAVFCRVGAYAREQPYCVVESADREAYTAWREGSSIGATADCPYAAAARFLWAELGG